MEQRVLPGYVHREHDRVLAEAVREAGQGYSRMAVLVGESSTGKTRACWEAVQPLAAKGWRLWHPFDPTRAEAALEELHEVGPRTVVWLNEAQHYFGDRAFGEQIAAAVHALLVEPKRAPVLVLGTLWHQYFTQYTALPGPDGADPHSRVRELLAGRTTSVPESFDASDLTAAALLAQDDVLLADALTRARADGRLCQDLAGGPALLERYENGSPAARALLEAAMDARRLGVGLHLPQAFLTDAAVDYFHNSDWDQRTENWAEKAYAELAEHVHGKQAPLRRVSPRPQRCPPVSSAPAGVATLRLQGPVFRLADYLEQHGRSIRRHRCPPVSFWDAAHIHVTQLDELKELAQAAEARHRLQWAHHLYQRAASHGDSYALIAMARLREEARDREGPKTLQHDDDHPGDSYAWISLARLREEAGDREGAENLYQRAADYDDTDALVSLARLREEAGDREGAENLYQRAITHGDSYALVSLARMREEVGDREGAETLDRCPDHPGRTLAMIAVARLGEEAGGEAGAAILYQDTDHPYALVSLARLREEVGDREGAETLYHRAASHGDSYALARLARLREETGDLESAETLYQRAADYGDTYALVGLARLRERAGDREGAEIMYHRAASHDDNYAWVSLARLREEAGDRESAESLAQYAGDYRDRETWIILTQMRERAGDREGAESIAQAAAEQGRTDIMARLLRMRQEAGDRESVEALAQRAADRGWSAGVSATAMGRALRRLWPYGLDPDGTPTRPWAVSKVSGLGDQQPAARLVHGGQVVGQAPNETSSEVIWRRPVGSVGQWWR
ncbi:hypothetical protein AB0407_35900 [Streptomyces microflavus]|uniref:tetratricopeptide repeat protein n=1 Tax=Streptomyces microflavus TaxID=1919 RepID=UPI00344BBA6F